MGKIITLPFAALLRWIYAFTQSYGLSIIIFAVIVKVVLLPFQMKSKRNMIRMGRLSKKQQELQKQYAKNQQKFQEELQKLYQEEGVSPMGGCLWSFLPLFILMPLYSIIYRPVTHFMGFSDSEFEAVKELAHDICLQIAAAKPEAVRREEVNSENLEKEREIYRVKALESGKPEKIVDKIVEGQIEKYYKEVCLLEQVFVKDGDKTIKGVIAEVAKAVGSPIDVVRYARFERGEGIEKRKDNLAEEIAKMAQ